MLNLTGTAAGNIGITQLTWSNSLSGGSGSMNVANIWNINAVVLHNSINVITISARDAAGNIGSDTISVSYTSASPADTTRPTVAISTPTTGSTYTAPGGILSLAGTTMDNIGVTQVNWSNSLGGSGIASVRYPGM